MGKKYKRGNHGKRRQNRKNPFFVREQKINQLINQFVHDFFNLQRPAVKEEYDAMNKQRLEIKRLFDIQSDSLWRQSSRRRYIYYKQLTRFKYYYVAWKHFTYYIFLEKRYGFPLHLTQTLQFYMHTSCDVSSIIYML